MQVVSRAIETTDKWEGEMRPDTVHMNVSASEHLQNHVYRKRIYHAGVGAERGHRKLLWSAWCVARDIRVIVMSCNCEFVTTFGNGGTSQSATEFTHTERKVLYSRWNIKRVSFEVLLLKNKTFFFINSAQF